MQEFWIKWLPWRCWDDVKTNLNEKFIAFPRAKKVKLKAETNRNNYISFNVIKHEFTFKLYIYFISLYFDKFYSYFINLSASTCKVIPVSDTLLTRTFCRPILVLKLFLLFIVDAHNLLGLSRYCLYLQPICLSVRDFVFQAILPRGVQSCHEPRICRKINYTIWWIHYYI